MILAMIMVMMPTSSFAAVKKPGKVPAKSIKISVSKVRVVKPKITVKYNKAKNAKSYKLYRVTSKQVWKYWKTVKVSQKKKYSNKKKYKLVKKGKKFKVYQKKSQAVYTQLASSKKTSISFTGNWNTSYKLVVRAYNGKKAGAYSAAKTVKTGAKTYQKPVYDDYKTYVFFGSDTRNPDYYSKEDGGFSDVIMLLRINKKNKKIDLMSVYRDTYLNISGNIKDPEYSKCNWAFHHYGPETAVKMLEDSLDIKISGYISTNFIGVAEAIDKLGGVDIDIETDSVDPYYTKGEYEKYGFTNVPDVMNMYIDEMKRIYEGIYEGDSEHIVKTGKNHLSGLQAVAYCRVRYTKDGDYRRTQRQRDVLTAMVETFNNASMTQKIDIIQSVYPTIDTNITDSKEGFADFMSSLYSYGLGQRLGFPFYKTKKTIDETMGEYEVGTVVVPNTLEKNVIELHKKYYGEKWYTIASSLVKQYSKAIMEKTAKY